jgi:hypothetical protein
VSTPYDAPATRIGVTVVTSGPVPEGDGFVLRLAPALHDHPPGGECIACATAGDIRAQLFDLLQQRRAGTVAPFTNVVIDATRLRDPQAVVARFDAPALGLRDHTVARSFELRKVC